MNHATFTADQIRTREGALEAEIDSLRVQKMCVPIRTTFTDQTSEIDHARRICAGAVGFPPVDNPFVGLFELAHQIDGSGRTSTSASSMS
jgi:hypothetical protein